jgi:predicted ATPase
LLFQSLRFANWRQYREINLEFHPRLTVLTGANGAGKTTVLNLLSRHFGWQGTLVGTPRRSKGSLSFSSDYWTEDYLRDYEEWLERRQSFEQESPTPPKQPTQQSEIGSLTYSNGTTALLTVPESIGASFQINIRDQQGIQGLHIPSHRPIYSYQTVENIPTAPRKRDQAFSQYTDIVRARYYGGHHQRTPNYYMKETLIALATFGYGNQVIERNAESLEVFEGFQDVLRTILPPTLGFSRLTVRLPEVVLVTRTGDFSLDAVSGGIASLVDLAWQVFMYASADTPFVVTIDEPENHLHPELQRTILGTFLQAFPHVQFICATHNPFIVTSVPESATYALRYGPDHRVISESLATADRTGSSNEILRDVLGVPSSSPTWVQRNIEEISADLAGSELTPELVTALRNRLKAMGLDRFVPDALARLAKEQLTK